MGATQIDGDVRFGRGVHRCAERETAQVEGELLPQEWGAALGAVEHSPRIPRVQFDTETDDVPELVTLADRRLLDGENANGDEQRAALEWWLAPNTALPDETSSAEAFMRTAFTRDVLDRLLSTRDDE